MIKFEDIELGMLVFYVNWNHRLECSKVTAVCPNRLELKGVSGHIGKTDEGFKGIFKTAQEARERPVKRLSGEIEVRQRHLDWIVNKEVIDHTNDSPTNKERIMDVLEITKEYLKNNGYDGLYHEDECGCELSDIEPCGEIMGECVAGYKRPCDCGEGCDFHIGPKKVTP